MLTITTMAHLPTEKERIEKVKENMHLMDLADDVKLECSSGHFTYNVLKDLFNVGEQLSFRLDMVTHDVVRLTENQFEIHDMSVDWVSTVVDSETILDITKGKKSLSDLEWK